MFEVTKDDLIKITDIEKAIYKLDNLEMCMFYIRDEQNRYSYVYDSLLGYTFQPTKE